MKNSENRKKKKKRTSFREFITSKWVLLGSIIFLVLTVIMLVIFISEQETNSKINTLFDAFGDNACYVNRLSNNVACLVKNGNVIKPTWLNTISISKLNSRNLLNSCIWKDYNFAELSIVLK